MPLRHLIVLIANAHPNLEDNRYKAIAIRENPNAHRLVPTATQISDYLLQSDLSDAIDVFDKSACMELRRAARLQLVLRPASRD